MAVYVMTFEEQADASGEIRRARPLRLTLPMRLLEVELRTLSGCHGRTHPTTVFVDDVLVLQTRVSDCTPLTRDLDLRLGRRAAAILVSASGFSPGEIVTLRARVTATLIWLDADADVARRLACKSAPELEHAVAQAEAGDYLEVDAFVAGSALAAPASAQTLSAAAAADQAALADRLRALSEAGADGQSGVAPLRSARGYWITNAIAVEGTREVVRELLERPDVAFLDAARHADDRELLDALIELPGPGAVGRDAPAPAAGQGALSWAVRKLGAPRLWDLGIRGQGVLCALIDSGVDYGHPDLAGRLWDGGPAFPHHGYDFAEADDDPFDRQGHGTACAGLIVGDGRAGLATGVAPEATLMALRVGGSQRTLWAAVQFAVEQGADVICLPLSWKLPPGADATPWRRLCAGLAAVGVALVGSVGNLGQNSPMRPHDGAIGAPANSPPPWHNPSLGSEPEAGSAIAVGATDSQDRLAGWSARGPAVWRPGGSAEPLRLVKPDFCAPGAGLRSCGGPPDGATYRSVQGTSAAAAHAAGCLCLLASAARSAGRPLSAARMQEALEQTALRIQGQTAAKENHFGAGRIDVFRAFHYGRQRDWW